MILEEESLSPKPRKEITLSPDGNMRDTKRSSRPFAVEPNSALKMSSAQNTSRDHMDEGIFSNQYSYENASDQKTNFSIALVASPT
jgi:flagellar basal body rod protein FlgF